MEIAYALADKAPQFHSPIDAIASYRCDVFGARFSAVLQRDPLGIFDQ